MQSLPTDVLGEIVDTVVDGDAQSIVVMHINQKFKTLIEARKPSWKKFYIIRKGIRRIEFLEQMLTTREGLDWCISQGYKRDPKRTFEIIVKTGNLELLQYAAKSLKPVIWRWNIAALKTAITFKHLEVIKWITEEVGAAEHEDIEFDMADCGDIKIVEWMIDNGYRFTNTSFRQFALLSENLEFIKWGLEVKGLADYNNLDVSRFHLYEGSFEIFKWLKKGGCVFEDLQFGLVTVEMIEHIPEDSYQALLKAAARGGNLSVFRALIENYGVDWQLPAIIRSAVFGGSINLLEWLVGRPDWNSDHLIHSVTNEPILVSRNIEILEWLLTRGVKLDYNQLIRLLVPYSVNFEVLKWLHGKCITEISGWVPPPNKCEQAAGISGDSEVLKWMVNNGFYCGSEVLGYNLAKRGDTEMMDWLEKKRVGFVFNSKTVFYAAQAEQLETLIWLFDNGCAYSTRTRLRI